MNRQESIKHLKDEWFSFTNTMKESLETLIPELKGYDENSVKDWLINKLTNFKELSQASNNANNVKIANAAIKWVENAEQPVNISKDESDILRKQLITIIEATSLGHVILNEEERKTFVNFLKQKQWKPTENQIKDLREAIIRSRGCNFSLGLQTLLDALENLK